MNHVFYFSLIIPVLFFMSVLADTTKFLHLVRTDRGKLSHQELKELEMVCLLSLGALIVIFAGLFSTQWIIFAPTFGLYFVHTKSDESYKIKALLRLIFILAAVINEYHLHLTL